MNATATQKVPATLASEVRWSTEKDGTQVIRIPTKCGSGAEARRDRAKQHTEEAWAIGYPWGDDRFYGTRYEVTAHMNKNIANHNEDGDEIESAA